jgi:hypothetical protein
VSFDPRRSDIAPNVWGVCAGAGGVLTQSFKTEHDLFVEDVLRIEAAQRADAECIADALAEYNASVEPKGAVVIVTGMSSGTLVTAVLDALKACLDANAIAPVKVSIDDQHYVMEEAA